MCTDYLHRDVSTKGQLKETVVGLSRVDVVTSASSLAHTKENTFTLFSHMHKTTHIFTLTEVGV